MKRSHRAIKPSAKLGDEPSDGKRKCESSGCPATHPVCFARVSETCTGNGWTSRWYHMTAGEHYCNECFEHFYRSHKDGHADFDAWKREWSAKSRTGSSLRLFMAENILPFWAQCQKPACGKWRQVSREVDLTVDFVKNFQCHSVFKKDKQDGCAAEEDERIKYVSTSLWFIQSRCTAYLKHSPCAPLLSGYYLDGVGLSPLDNDSHGNCDQESHPLHAFAVTPDMMLDEEIDAFPSFAHHCPYSYLALRNTLMVIWALNPKEWLSKKKCMPHIICRGLTRVFCEKMLDEVIHYLTRLQFINIGLVGPPTKILSHIHNTQPSVLVIGAGISGLAAAHLLHSHGFKVTVIEGRGRIGGRIDTSTGAGPSSHVLNGDINNPLSVISYQADLPLVEVQEACQLFMSDGNPIDREVDRRIEFHYNAVLDIVSEWRKKKEIQDASLASKFTEFHEEFIRETDGFFTHGVFSQDEEEVIQFHLANLEFACGSSLDRVSSLHWDHNEAWPQFCGRHVMSQDGFRSLMARLNEGLDVRLDSTVKKISWSEDKGVSVCIDTESFTADKVIVSVPLGVLKAGSVEFCPPLPLSKKEAIDRLGVGLVEKVTLWFEESFWTQQVKGHQMFGCVPKNKLCRGLFNLFHASPPQMCDEGKHCLTAYIVGHGIDLVKDKSDPEIVDMCLDTLRALFPGQSIPKPTGSHVSHWGSDPLSLMSFSFLPVGTSGDLYDTIAEDVDGKLFFAGEATNKRFPQTVTGAYMSGVREAWKIIDSYADVNDQ